MSEAASVLDAPASATPAPAGTPGPEGKPTVPAAPAPSKAIATAIRREQALQRQREELATQKASIARERAEIAAARAEAQKLATRPENPLRALERFGWSYKDATEFALNDSQPTAEQIARETRAELERDRADARQREENAASEAARQAEVMAEETTAEFRQEIDSVVKANAQKYELTALQDAGQLVYDVIETHFQRTAKAGKPVILSIQEAAELVEKHLEKKAEKLLSSGKLKAKFQPVNPANQQPGKTGQDPAQPNRTLSNGLTPSTPTLVRSASIEDDRMRRAMAALGG